MLKKTERTYGGRRKPLRAFTEQGVAMLASVLRSPRAVAVSVALVRAFAQLRELLATHRELAAKLSELERKLAGHDHAIGNLFETIRSMKQSFAPKGRSAAARRWRREAQRSSPRLAEGESRRVPSGRRSEQMGFHTLMGPKKHTASRGLRKARPEPKK